MAYKTDIELKAQVDAVIVVNGNREITPPLDNSIRTNFIDSKLNLAGGNVLTGLTGYTTELNPSDNKHLTTKKYVDDQDATNLAAANAYTDAEIAANAYDDTPVFYKDGSRAITGNVDSGGFNISNVGTLSLPTGTGLIAVGTYGTISETISGLAYITGNALKADPIAPNIVVKTADDAGNFIRMRYDKGISFHTNLVGLTGTQFSDDDNEVLVIGIDGSVEFSNLTATTVPYLDANKKLVSSAVTPTQLSYVDATSSIQTQLNARVRVIYNSAVAIPHTGSTGESAALVTVPIPALGVNSSIRVYILSSFTANANAKTLRVKLGATSFSSISAANTNNNCKQFTISNRGATNSQVCVNSTNTSGLGTSGSTPITTGAVDTSVSTNLTVTIDLSNGADTGTIESLIVEILN